MSLRATAWAWTVETAPTAKFVLVALADHADEAGLCWPSLARLRTYTRLSERAIRHAIRQLEAERLIATDKREGRISRYNLSINAAPEPRQHVPGWEMDTPAARAGDPGSTCPPPRQHVPGTPASPAPEPSRTVIEPSVNLPSPPSASRRGVRLPDGWRPADDDVAFAAGLGLDPDETAAEFRDYWQAVPGARGVKLDWSATFRNSCRMQAKRRRPPPQRESKMAWLIRDMMGDKQ